MSDIFQNAKIGRKVEELESKMVEELSPALKEALRAELHRIVDQPITVSSLRDLERVAAASKKLLLSLTTGMGILKEAATAIAGPDLTMPEINADFEGGESPWALPPNSVTIPQAETFGAQAIRELVKVMRPEPRPAPTKDTALELESLTRALESLNASRTNGDPAAARLAARITTKIDALLDAEDPTPDEGTPPDLAKKLVERERREGSGL